MQKGGTLTRDVAIGEIFTAALAIGTLVTPSEDLTEALFGGFQKPDVAGISNRDSPGPRGFTSKVDVAPKVAFLPQKSFHRSFPSAGAFAKSG